MFVVFGLICCNIQIKSSRFLILQFYFLFHFYFVLICVAKYYKSRIMFVLAGLICCNMQVKSSSLLILNSFSFLFLHCLFGWQNITSRASFSSYLVLFAATWKSIAQVYFYSCLCSILFLNLVCIWVTKYSKPSIILVLFGLICCNMQANSSSLLCFILCSFSIFDSLLGWQNISSCASLSS